LQGELLAGRIPFYQELRRAERAFNGFEAWRAIYGNHPRVPSVNRGIRGQVIFFSPQVSVSLNELSTARRGVRAV
jgi:hypothetical protein